MIDMKPMNNLRYDCLNLFIFWTVKDTEKKILLNGTCLISKPQIMTIMYVISYQCMIDMKPINDFLYDCLILKLEHPKPK